MFCNNLIFKTINPSHPELPKVIMPSIGFPSEAKVKEVLRNYDKGNSQLIKCFLKEQLISIIGIKLAPKQMLMQLIFIKK